MDRLVRTFSDCIELLRDFQEFNDPRAERIAKRAVMDAYMTFPTLHNWNFLKRRQLVTTVAPYSTGTIAFDLTGGARERLVTLTGGTWPIWADKGRIIVGESSYDVLERVSDTQIVLEEQSSPAADIASGTEYQLIRQRYPFVDEIQKQMSCIEVNTQLPLMTEIMERASTARLWWNTPGQPLYCVHRSDTGTVEVEFHPPPDSERTYEISYIANPRRPKLSTPHVTGTCTTTMGSALVSFSSATLPDNITGCVLRTGTTASDPVGVMGSSQADTIPFNEQYEILERVSSSQVRLKTPATATRSTVKYIIDDMIDLNARVCNEAFQRLCEQNFVVNMRYADQAGNDGGTIPASTTARARSAIRIAMEQDSQYHPNQSQFSGPYHWSEFGTVIY